MICGALCDICNICNIFFTHPLHHFLSKFYHLAGKEINIGRFYLKQGKYIAAANRFKYVIDNYQTTSHVPEALHRLVEVYLRLGLVDEARKTAALLGHNYPGDQWYQDSYELLAENSILEAGTTPPVNKKALRMEQKRDKKVAKRLAKNGDAIKPPSDSAADDVSPAVEEPIVEDIGN